MEEKSGSVSAEFPCLVRRSSRVGCTPEGPAETQGSGRHGFVKHGPADVSVWVKFKKERESMLLPSPSTWSCGQRCVHLEASTLPAHNNSCREINAEV